MALLAARLSLGVKEVKTGGQPGLVNFMWLPRVSSHVKPSSFAAATTLRASLHRPVLILCSILSVRVRFETGGGERQAGGPRRVCCHDRGKMIRVVFGSVRCFGDVLVMDCNKHFVSSSLDVRQVECDHVAACCLGDVLAVMDDEGFACGCGDHEPVARAAVEEVENLRVVSGGAINSSGATPLANL